MTFRPWRFLRNRTDNPGLKLLGGVELVTPSSISGWVHADGPPLVEVRLLLEDHLVAQARLDQSRPDVSEHLRAAGLNPPDDRHGFLLRIPADLPPLAVQSVPRLIALRADGSGRQELGRVGPGGPLGPRLSSALSAELRGLEGHVDGFTPDHSGLHGWCTRHGSLGPATVHLQAEGKPPLPVVCNQPRPGMGRQGLPETCGFLVNLEDAEHLAGCHVWLSFDADGLLPLPAGEPMPLQLPSRSPATSAGGLSPRVNAEATATLQSDLNPDLQAHWLQLEAFNGLLDRLENRLLESERMERLQAQLPPPSRRAARFRLWR